MATQKNRKCKNVAVTVLYGKTKERGEIRVWGRGEGDAYY